MSLHHETSRQSERCSMAAGQLCLWQLPWKRDHPRIIPCRRAFKGRSKWAIDWGRSELATVHICSTCYRWKWATGQGRPVNCAGKVARKPRLTGPCHNPTCHTEESPYWRLDTTMPGIILCTGCRMWQDMKPENHGKFRPTVNAKIPEEERRCIHCNKTGIGIVETTIRPGEYRCNACRKNLHKTINTETTASATSAARKIPRDEMRKLVSRQCRKETAEKTALQHERSRNTCWNCCVQFGKIGKAWCDPINEWICVNCRNFIIKHQHFKVTHDDLKDLDMRCEFCQSRFSKLLSEDFKLQCLKCRSKSPTRKAAGDCGYRKEAPREDGEKTYQEFKRDQTKWILGRSFSNI